MQFTAQDIVDMAKQQKVRLHRMDSRNQNIFYGDQGYERICCPTTVLYTKLTGKIGFYDPIKVSELLGINAAEMNSLVYGFEDWGTIDGFDPEYFAIGEEIYRLVTDAQPQKS